MDILIRKCSILVGTNWFEMIKVSIERLNACGMCTCTSTIASGESTNGSNNGSSKGSRPTTHPADRPASHPTTHPTTLARRLSSNGYIQQPTPTREMGPLCRLHPSEQQRNTHCIHTSPSSFACASSNKSSGKRLMLKNLLSARRLAPLAPGPSPPLPSRSPSVSPFAEPPSRFARRLRPAMPLVVPSLLLSAPVEVGPEAGARLFESEKWRGQQQK